MAGRFHGARRGLFKAPAVVAAAWAPASLPGYLASYKADGVLLTTGSVPAANNDLLTQWSDTGGSQHLVDVNFAGGQSGQYLSAGLNSKPTVLFDSSGSGSHVMHRSSFPMGGSNKAFFYGYISIAAAGAVFKNVGGYVSGGETTVADAHSCAWLVCFNPANDIIGQVYGTTNTGDVTVTADTGVRAGLIIDGPNSQIILVINGVKQTPVSITPANFVTNGELVIGAGRVDGAGSSPDVKVSEWIVCNDVPSVSDLAAADSYLTRWD